MHTLQEIATVLKKAKCVAIFTHTRPDGDALGCSLALFCALKNLGISSHVYAETPPASLSLLPYIDRIERIVKDEFDACVVLDCADESRLGIFYDDIIKAKRKRIPIINIDHHVSNTRFGDYDYVRTCAANCMNVFNLIKDMGASFDKDIAECLMIGLLTDSGNFSHDDVEEESFLLAAKCMEYKIDIRRMQYELFKKQSLARAKLHALTMGKIRYYFDNRFAVAVITKQMMEECGASAQDTEGFVDFPLNIDGVEVAATLLENKSRQYQVSLRSKEYANVNQIAGQFGGGGHVRASGCMLFGDLEEILDKLSYVVSQYLED